MPLMILPFAIILLSVFSLLRNRSQRSMKESQDAFWEKEQRANRTRRQDISQLDYIQIPLDTFPIGACTDPGLSDLEQTLQTLSSRKILNLSGISNTDLKLQYGAANLNILSDWLLALGRWQDAVRVLEFGVACGSDVSKNYTLLGNVYREHGETGKLNELTEIVRSSDMLLKDTILKQLKE